LSLESEQTHQVETNDAVYQLDPDPSLAVLDTASFEEDWCGWSSLLEDELGAKKTRKTLV
jgi:hypothetical protein